MLARLLVALALHSTRPLPADQWTVTDQLELGRALVGEGGSAEDSAAIAHLLARRWWLLRSRGPPISFRGLVRAYCSPLRRDLPLTPRRAWVRAIAWRDLPPEIQHTVTAFGEGSLPDPCGGRADHFDSVASARARGVTWPRVDCGPGVEQAYYAVR